LPGSSKLRITAPVAVATQGINVGQNPRRNYKIRVFARLTEQVQTDGNIVPLHPDQKFFSVGDLLGVWIRGRMTGNRFNK